MWKDTGKIILHCSAHWSAIWVREQNYEVNWVFYFEHQMFAVIYIMIFGDEFQFPRLIKSFIGNAYMYMYLPASKKNIEIVGEKRSLSYKNSYLNKWINILSIFGVV